MCLFEREKPIHSLKEGHLTSIADGSVRIPTSAEAASATPPCFGEVVLMAAPLRKHGVLTKISQGVRFARRRFGHYEGIDFVAVRIGSALSRARTLAAFYESLQPFAVPFRALFERTGLPSRSALSRFLAQLSQEPVEARRACFLDALLRRPLTHDANAKHPAGLLDRTGDGWVVFDIDGTREAARQRAVPKGAALPAPFGRLDEVCAAGSSGRTRGAGVRTRTLISQAHSFQWLGSFGNPGHGHARQERRKALAARGREQAAHQLPKERALLHIFGPYGTGAVLCALAGFALVSGGKEYTVLDHPLVQARLHLPPEQVPQPPESQSVRSLYDCPQVPVGSVGRLGRVLVATQPAGKKKSPVGVSRATEIAVFDVDLGKGKKKSPVGVSRAGVVDELFFSTLPQQAFPAAAVVEL